MKRITGRGIKGTNNSGTMFTLLVMLSAVAVLLFITIGVNKISVLTGLNFLQGSKYYYQNRYGPDEGSQAEPKPSAFTEDLPPITPPKISEESTNDPPGRMGDPPDIPEKQKGKIIELTAEKSGSNFKDVWVKNATGNRIDIEEILNSPSPLKIKDVTQPTVLIYHTHTTESFLTYDTGWFDRKNCDRSDDPTIGVCAVGDVVTRILKQNNIGVIHDTEIYDSPQYSGAYSRSAETIEKYLKKYPSLKIVLDIHRDSMVRDNGDRLKPTIEHDGKKLAQIMIISGCENESSLEMPNWRDNLNLAVKLQNALEQRAHGITRPVSFKIARYNQQYSSGGLLLEVGTDVNTIEEALNSAQVLGDSLTGVIGQIAGK